MLPDNRSGGWEGGSGRGAPGARRIGQADHKALQVPAGLACGAAVAAEVEGNGDDTAGGEGFGERREIRRVPAEAVDEECHSARRVCAGPRDGTVTHVQSEREGWRQIIF